MKTKAMLNEYKEEVIVQLMSTPSENNPITINTNEFEVVMDFNKYKKDMENVEKNAISK